MGFYFSEIVLGLGLSFSGPGQLLFPINPTDGRMGAGKIEVPLQALGAPGRSSSL